MLLYRTKLGPVIETAGLYRLVSSSWDELINRPRLAEFLRQIAQQAATDSALAAAVAEPLAPLESQEVWAAGVTYYRSRTARMEEALVAGGASFYDRVYEASRPELFLKATAHRVVGTGQLMRLRSDSHWIVPEPELVLVINRSAEIIGYTVGNDLSCRDIEGENPLYLPQAKTFDRCAAVGPGVLVSEAPPARDSQVRLSILRNGESVVEDATTIAQMKRGCEELVGWLFRENSHPHGCLLMTGTGIVPSPNFTLQAGDTVRITIDGIGTLTNTME